MRTLLVLALLASACGATPALKPRPTSSGPKPAAQPAKPAPSVSDHAAVLVTAGHEAGDKAVDALERAQAFHSAGALTAEQMATINGAFGKMGTKLLGFIASAKTVRADAALRSSAAELYKLFDDYIATLNSVGWSGEAIRAALDPFAAYLKTKGDR